VSQINKDILDKNTAQNITANYTEILNFIDGEFKPSSNLELLSNIDPSTSELYSTLPKSDALDVVYAVQSSKKAFEKWKETSAQERSNWLNKIADGIESNFNEFAEAESRDTGKPLWLAKQLDIPRAIENFRFFASRILNFESKSYEMKNTLSYVQKQPLGVCALISPWNLPLYLLSWKIAPCLAAGNVAICKPSEVTPMTAFLLAKVMKDVGLPKGVCNFIFGLGQEAGEALVSHPGVTAVSFTGGTATGKKIVEIVAPQFKKMSLELGGKNSAIILKDANLKKAVDVCVRSSFLNQGEICLCTERIFIQDEIYEDFKKLFLAEIEKLIVGDRKSEKTFMGPLVSEAHLNKVLACIELAKKDKAKILFGGNKIDAKDLPLDMKEGYFLQPTVMEDLSDCSELQQDEIFGPVVSLRPFKYAHEAVKWANTTPYGLCATLFTQDISKAHKLSQNLDVGTVWINTWLKRDLRVPFGGMKSSGLGREGGDYSLDFFTEAKTVCLEI
jgi:aminomuconate-semialdehyde/2-hydroxymuconate-6-semialdehyde dehydrogenase